MEELTLVCGSHGGKKEEGEGEREGGCWREKGGALETCFLRP